MIEEFTPYVIDSGFSVKVELLDSPLREKSVSPPLLDSFWTRVMRDADPDHPSYTIAIGEIKQHFFDFQRKFKGVLGVARRPD